MRGIITAGIILITLIATAKAVVIQPGVEYAPTQSMASYYWNCTYEDNKSAVIEATWIQVGGIKVETDSTVKLLIVIEEWNPDNKDEDSEVVLEFRTVSQRPGWFKMTIEGLVPGKDYTIVKIVKDYRGWIVKTADDNGRISFRDRVSSESRYIVVCGHEEEEEIIPISPKPTPGFEAIYAIAGVIIVAYLMGRRNC